MRNQKFSSDVCDSNSQAGTSNIEDWGQNISKTKVSESKKDVLKVLVDRPTFKPVSQPTRKDDEPPSEVPTYEEKSASPFVLPRTEFPFEINSFAPSAKKDSATRLPSLNQAIPHQGNNKFWSNGTIGMVTVLGAFFLGSLAVMWSQLKRGSRVRPQERMLLPNSSDHGEEKGEVEMNPINQNSSLMRSISEDEDAVKADDVSIDEWSDFSETNLTGSVRLTVLADKSEKEHKAGEQHSSPTNSPQNKKALQKSNKSAHR